MDTALVLTIYHKQRTMKDTKEIGAREPNQEELVTNETAIHLNRAQN